MVAGGVRGVCGGCAPAPVGGRLVTVWEWVGWALLGVYLLVFRSINQWTEEEK